jgi:hypothetical protein
MKQLWSESDAHGVIKQIKAMLRAPYRCTDGTLSRCEAWTRAFELCTQYKLDIEPPPTAATDRVAALRAAKDFDALNEAYRLEGLNFEVDRETRAMTRWTAMRRWAAE